MIHKLIMENWRRFVNEEFDWDDLESYENPRRSFKNYGNTGREKAELEADRDFKREWNSKADHDFFNKEVIKVHWVGAFGGKFALKFGSGKDKNTNPEILINIKTWGDISSAHKDELSCVGYLAPPVGGSGAASAPYGFMVDGWVSYASSGDAQTEWTSRAKATDIKKYSSSGLPKRASSEQRSNAMYGKDDFVEPQDSPDGYNELTVDNWKATAIILDINNDWWKWVFKRQRAPGSGYIADNQKARKEELAAIIEYCRSNGMKLLDTNLQPIQSMGDLNV